MMDQSYKLINILLLIIIAALCGEIYLLNERLSEMTELIKSLNDKIVGLEEAQKELANANLEKQTNLKDSNYTLLGISAIILTIVVLVYFGGINPGSMAEALIISADQAAAETIGQNNLNSNNLIDCLNTIKDMNQQIIAQLDVRFDVLCSKTNAVLNAIIKGNSLNATLSSIRSSIEDFE
jgi:hypothetical protein